MGYSVFNRPESLFTFDWLFHGKLGLSHAPFALAIQFTIPIAILSGLILLTIWLDKRRDMGTELLILWIVSGLTILVVLPDGWLHHDYYLWALLAPLALTGAFIADQLIGKIPKSMTWKNTATVALAISLMVAAIGYAGAVETQTKFRERYTEINGFHPGELVDAGKTVADMDPSSYSSIVFVGEREGSPGWSSPAISRVLIYGKVHIGERGFQELRYINDTEQLENCEIGVLKRGQTVEVQRC